MVEGLLGGMSTITATINAYMSDVTPDGSRAAVFARLAGTMMVAFASGPVLGSFLIRFSGNMYVNTCVDIPLTLQHAAVLHERVYSRDLCLFDPLCIT
jgi:MFS family permease